MFCIFPHTLYSGIWKYTNLNFWYRADFCKKNKTGESIIKVITGTLYLIISRCIILLHLHQTLQLKQKKNQDFDIFPFF